MNQIRDGIKQVLDWLSSKEKMAKHDQHVYLANMSAELIFMWFDDLYQLNSKQYKDEFSTHEQKILKEFNEFFQFRRNDLPRALGAMHKSPEWNDIVKNAQSTIGLIDW